MNDETKWCKDIGMFAVDRPLSSCAHATDFCRENCYNLKFYKAFDLTERDKRLKKFWDELTGEKLKKILDRKRNQTDRVRLMTRGEAFKTEEDVEKVRDLLVTNDDRDFWIPTKAWRNDKIRKLIEEKIIPLDNAYVLASTDPSNTDEELEKIKDWPTMFFGDDSDTKGRVKCPKTWENKEGHCAQCEKGCFSGDNVDVHLKQH